MIDMGKKTVYPCSDQISKNDSQIQTCGKEAGVDASVQAETLEEITVLLKEARAALARLEEVTAQAAAKEEGPVQANSTTTEVSSGNGESEKTDRQTGNDRGQRGMADAFLRRSDLRSLINQRNEEKTGCDLNENRVRIFVMGGNKKYEDSSRIETACDKDRSQELSCL